MEPSVILKPDTYYVGDPGYILPNEDLRTLFSEFMMGGIRTGLRDLIASRKFTSQGLICDFYWTFATPHKSGTLYGEKNKGWGFEWGVFGAVPWKWVENKDSYLDNKFEFFEPFECSFNDKGILIGHLNFTFNPK